MAQSRTTTRVVTRNVVKALGLATAAGTVIVAPNSGQMISMIMKHLDKRIAQKSLSHLKYQKLVEVSSTGNGELQYRLTKKGWQAFEKINIDELAIPTPKRWDNKWRLVMFDIPLSHQKQRQYLLHRLRLLDFYMLQRSAWIHPFDCEREIGVLLKYLGLERYVSFIVVDSGNFTDHATSHFKKSKLLM